MSLPLSPAGVAGAYARVQAGPKDATATGGTDFSGALQRAVQGVLDTSRQADTMSMKALSGNANLTEVVTAVSRAEIAMQTATSIRDRMVQAYQDVMRMPI